MKQTAVELILEFFKRMNTNDFQTVGELLADDYLLEWPQSGERIRGRENFVAVNQEYPALGPWRFTINTIVVNEDEAASDVSVTDGTQAARALTFTTVKNGKIIKQIEYWPEKFPAPENRHHLVEMME